MSVLMVSGESAVLPTAVPGFCNTPQNLKLDSAAGILKVGRHKLDSCPVCLATVLNSVYIKTGRTACSQDPFQALKRVSFSINLTWAPSPPRIRLMTSGKLLKPWGASAAKSV